MALTGVVAFVLFRRRGVALRRLVAPRPDR